MNLGHAQFPIKGASVVMPPALTGKLTNLIFLHVTVDELERRRSTEPQLVSTEFAAEDKTN